MAAPEKASTGAVTNLTQYFQDSWTEIGKVSRPTKQETIQATIVVFGMIFVFAILLGAIDLTWGWVMRQILT